MIKKKQKKYGNKKQVSYKKAAKIVNKKNTKNYKKDGKFRMLLSMFIISMFCLILSSILVLSYIQTVSASLPDPDDSFVDKALASEIYDSQGQLLYRVAADEDRDPVKLEDIPGYVIWAFLAAEDIDFFQHEGVDYSGIVRCSLKTVVSNEVSCGASTITQQLVRKTLLNDEVKLDRKVREMIVAMKMEQEYDKNQILEMYLTIVPMGGNIYGITRASRFYFDKEVNELSMAEAVILASIPQNPSILSPTKSTHPDLSHNLLRERRSYVVDQLSKNIGRINKDLKKRGEKPILERRLRRAKLADVNYARPDFQIKSPHFVFFVLNQLQTKPYIGDSPLSITEIESKGYKIYTTLDSEMQQIAEEQVKKGVDVYGKIYGAQNAGLVATEPKTGRVLAMVGSYDYFGKASPAGCQQGLDCKFEPQVNIVNTLQAYGSTMKPMIYYQAMMKGLVTPETIMDDSKIFIGNYVPKNYDGRFSGKHTARYMLVNSRNIPAIALLDNLKTENFVNEIKNWGYTTFTGPYYGPAVAVGGADITMIEHAQAYSTFANNGTMTKYQVIERIEDKDGRIIFSHQPQQTKVADERGVYLVNNMLNARNGGPGYGFDGRDIAGKTGTSEHQKETLYVGYTPEIVAVGILGNNNNAPMIYGASGFSSAKPWVGEFIQRVSYKVDPTPFHIPAGIYRTNGGDLIIGGISNPGSEYVFKSYK